ADWDCIALDASAGKRPGLLDLAHALARLAARGHAVDLATWEAGRAYPVTTAKPGLTVPIGGANYVRPKPARPTPSANGRSPASPTLDARPASPPAPPGPPPAAAVASLAPRTLMNDTPTNP